MAWPVRMKISTQLSTLHLLLKLFHVLRQLIRLGVELSDLVLQVSLHCTTADPRRLLWALLHAVDYKRSLK